MQGKDRRLTILARDRARRVAAFPAEYGHVPIVGDARGRGAAAAAATSHRDRLIHCCRASAEQRSGPVVAQRDWACLGDNQRHVLAF